jgi:hypothetical protein
MPHGTFFRKGVIHLDDGRPLQLKDLVVGGDIKMLGQEFFITDADEFTRKYFQYVCAKICPLLWLLRCARCSFVEVYMACCVVTVWQNVLQNAVGIISGEQTL